jgi:hypothetical protein
VKLRENKTIDNPLPPDRREQSYSDGWHRFSGTIYGSRSVSLKEITRSILPPESSMGISPERTVRA